MKEENKTGNKKKQWDVYVFGDVNIDLVIPGVKRLPAPGQEEVVEVMKTFAGGGAALFALGLGKLGLKPVLHGCVGKDCYGGFLVRELERQGVDCALLEQREDLDTGISLCFTDERERSFLTYRGGNHQVRLSDLCFEEVCRAGHIHVTGYEGGRNHEEYFCFLRKLKAYGEITVSFDLGWDPQEKWEKRIYQLFPYIDVLFMNETEALHYSGKEQVEEAAREFARESKLVAVKLGGKGSLAVKGDRVYHGKPFQVKAVDTTGAGDSFNAGFIYGFLTGKGVEECLEIGNACGAKNVTALGGNTAFPTRKELEAFLQEQGDRRKL